jgi:hypothetical protein
VKFETKGTGKRYVHILTEEEFAAVDPSRN